MKELNGLTVIEQLQRLSSAEDFFLYFFLPYDEKVVRVARLHILRRMGDYIRNTDFSGLTDDEIFLTARLQLKRAYSDFVDSSPLQEKVFKVFHDKADETAGRFVRIEEVAMPAMAAE